MRCQVCSLPRANLQMKQSKLIPSIQLTYCSSCLKKGLEPRHIILLAARSKVDVSEYIKERKYIGDPIKAEEVM